MAGPLVSPPDVDEPDGDPLVMGVDDERADEVLSALSATTTRRVLSALHDEPGPPSDLAERLDTTVQNVQYHLGKLDDAGLVRDAGTAYSAKGREMTVYAPSDQALVFVAGPSDGGGGDAGLVGTLKRLLGGVGALALASVVVDRVLTAGAFLSGTGGAAPRPGDATESGTEAAAGADTTTATEAAGATPTPTEAPATTPTATAADGTATATDGATTFAAGTETAAPSTTPTPQPTPTTTATEHATSTATEPATATPTEAVADTVAGTTQGGGAVDAAAAAMAHSPGLLFFLGGLAALLLVVGVARLR